MYEARLAVLNKLMHRVPWKKRRVLILKLNRCKESLSSQGESLTYKKERLGFDIYSAIRGMPFMFPKFSCFIEKEDVENRHLLEQIMSGINGYLKAPIEKQRAFQRNLLNPWIFQNIVARFKGRFQNSN